MVDVTTFLKGGIGEGCDALGFEGQSFFVNSRLGYFAHFREDKSGWRVWIVKYNVMEVI